jgi:hypothetical protein
VLTDATDSRGRVQGGGRGRPDGPQSHSCRGQVVGLTDHRPRALMPDIQITVSPAVMGSSHRVGPDSDHSVIVPLRRQRGSWHPAGAVVEGGHRFARCAEPV